jgi:type I restriction enzyme M protein
VRSDARPTHHRTCPFAERLEEMNEELERLNAEARELEERIAVNVAEFLEGKA